ncbi:Acetyltransferase (GNAT) family protein [Kaistia soli DSM 19436]|uniref:Acetyltransferase (GNAT) family protein n=1 Tax=Kaistia soli DSM 19436 TaxID=1122133 RepID=A0A1M5A4N9_9HYPH|nr:GNAT family N-acetyltransferase [Kaistia soli]SHF25238.1 Acetyltransferase (GNAT) family protein [Kaistia soli DSM 19436]
MKKPDTAPAEAGQHQGRTTLAAFQIAPAIDGADLADVARLFAAYVASLGVDLTYQDFAGELARLPGQYGPPDGALLIARDADGLAIGCVALRPFAPEVVEMKRMYVAPEGRGLGLGRGLLQAVLREARRLGAREILLDTLPELSAAIALYRSAGFTEIPPYYATPIERTIFFRLTLGG